MKHKSYESSYATKQVICASLKKLMDNGSIQEIFDKYGVLYVAPEA